MDKTFICVSCGREAVRNSGSQKYCSRCKSKTYAQLHREAGKRRDERNKAAAAALRRRKEEAEEARRLDHRDLKGKSLARVDAEAKAFGLTYGQYTAAVASGSIDQVLKHKGIDNPREILKKIKAK